jgi:hypothetical protein
MAAGARGPSVALALREAQRRGATATQDIGAAAAAQQNQMAQQAALANQQAAMQAQQTNAGIAQQNAQGLQKGIGVAAGAMGGAMMMSDFTAKEDIRPAPARVDRIPAWHNNQYGLTQHDVRRQLQANRERQYDQDIAVEAAAADRGPSAVQQLGVTQRQGADAQLQREQGEAGMSGFLRNVSLGLSDIRAKEQVRMISRGDERPSMGKAGIRVSTDRLRPAAPGYPARIPPPGYGMSSDFETKEPADTRRDLGPIDPVSYRYKEQDAVRMALEQGATPEEQAFVYADKREPRDGIIAQQLEQSPEFDDAVVETPAGKAVVEHRALSSALAELAGMDKRLRRAGL